MNPLVTTPAKTVRRKGAYPRHGLAAGRQRDQAHSAGASLVI